MVKRCAVDGAFRGQKMSQPSLRLCPLVLGVLKLDPRSVRVAKEEQITHEGTTPYSRTQQGPVREVVQSGEQG